MAAKGGLTRESGNDSSCCGCALVWELTPTWRCANNKIHRVIIQTMINILLSNTYNN